MHSQHANSVFTVGQVTGAQAAMYNQTTENLQHDARPERVYTKKKI